MIEEFNTKARLMHQKAQRLNALFAEHTAKLNAVVMDTEEIFRSEIKNLCKEEELLTKKY